MLAIGFGPSLTARGAPPVTGFDFSMGILPPGATLLRASGGSRFDAAGVLRIEPPDVARFDHDPATGAFRGLLIEPEATNEALMSEAIDNAVWEKSSAVVIAGESGAAPDGTATADSIADTSSVAYESVTQTFAEAAQRAISAFIAKDTVGRATRSILVRGRSPDFADLYFDTATGEFAIRGGVSNVRTEDCGDFWRLAFSLEECGLVRLFPAAGADAAWQTSPDATGTVVVWGVQAERGVHATSYIPAGTAPATRAADVLTLDWKRLGVADGPLAVRYVFDDDSTQDDMADVADGHATVPSTLARSRLRRVERR